MFYLLECLLLLMNWWLLENVEHCGGEPEQAVLWLHAHEQNKLHTEMISWITSVYECRLCKIYTVCKQPAIDGRSVAAVTNKKVLCVLKLEPSPLWLPMLCTGSPALPFTSHVDVQFQEIFKHAIKKYGIWPQANKYITNTLPQCSPASVGLAQARPNKHHKNWWPFLPIQWHTEPQTNHILSQALSTNLLEKSLP